ncbi:hypothetical protein Tsp_04272 [Trichinella spiralis]|uniref:hypothetical protein n=1 Tax=Trichinella spiralis TaxID=6334 RepID=UPI0001EFC106|nr:hypothetical protein Tsp_04272 [Trichinella spiralis]
MVVIFKQFSNEFKDKWSTMYTKTSNAEGVDQAIVLLMHDVLSLFSDNSTGEVDQTAVI